MENKNNMYANNVVMLKGENSEWYEQAIFILKSPKSAAGKNVVMEAEKIINSHMAKSGLIKYMAATKHGGAKPAAATQPPKIATQTRRYDFISLFIDVALVACSVFLGFVLHGFI